MPSTPLSPEQARARCTGYALQPGLLSLLLGAASKPFLSPVCLTFFRSVFCSGIPQKSHLNQLEAYLPSPALPCPQVSLLPQSEVWQLQLGALTPPLLSSLDTKVLGAGRGAWARDWLCDPERLCVSGTQISFL